MTAIITPNAFRKAYDGALRLAVDGTSTIWTFPNSRAGLGVTDNPDYPMTMDSTAFYENRVLGLVGGRVSGRGPLKLDRGFDAFLNAAFGPRTAGKLTPMNATIIPYAGGTALPFPGVWWNTLTITAEFSASGSISTITYEIDGATIDPKNVLGATALAAGLNEATAGIGLSTFIAATLSNGAASSPVIYDGIRRLTVVFSNNLTMDPSAYPGHAADRMAAGFTPGPFIGKLSLTQLRGAVTPLPASGGNNPITLKAPSGDGTRTMTLDMTCSFDGSGQSYSPGDYNANTNSYTLFGTNTTNGATAYPFACAVA